MNAAEKSATTNVRLPHLMAGDPGCGHDHSEDFDSGIDHVTEGNKKWLKRLGDVTSNGILVPSENSIARGPFIGPLNNFAFDERGHSDPRLEHRLMGLLNDMRLGRQLVTLGVPLGGFDERYDEGFIALKTLASSHAFQRLVDVMQIYPSGTADQANGVQTSNRHSHGLDAAEVAVYIALRIGLNPYLAAGAGAGHDTGHLGGGHPSEERMDEVLKDFGLGGFNHSHNSGLIARRLGLPSSVVHAHGHHSWSDPQGDLLNAVTKFADRIAYLSSDVTDVLRLSLFQWNELPTLFPNMLAVLKISSGEFARLGSQPDRAERLGRMIRVALSDDVVNTMQTHHVMGFSVPAQVLMTELRTFTAEFTFMNRAHQKWQADIADVTERYFKNLVGMHTPRLGREGAATVSLRIMSNLTETELFARASEWNIFPSGQDPRALIVGPSLLDVRAAIRAPGAIKSQKASVPLEQLFGNVHSVETGQFRTFLTVPECLEVLAASRDHGEDAATVFDTDQPVPEESHREVALPLRPGQHLRAVIFVPSPNTGREHNVFVNRVQAAIGKALESKVQASATPHGLRKVAKAHERSALNSILKIAEAMVEETDGPNLREPRPVGSDREQQARQRDWDALATAAVKEFHGKFVYAKFGRPDAGEPDARGVALETPELSLAN